MRNTYGTMKFGRPYKVHRKRHIGRWPTVLLIIFTVVYIVVFTAAQASRTMERVAAKKLEMNATQIINNVVKDTLDKGYYGKLLDISRSPEGKILSIATNTAEMNRLKYALTDNMLSALENPDIKNYTIPLGALTDMVMLSGLGPPVPFDILPYGGGKVDFRTSFTSAGVNQTLCEIYIDITADLYAVSPTLKVGATVTTSVVAERTVIVGDVPRFWTGDIR